MTNRLAIILGALVLGAILADIVFLSGDTVVFLGRRLLTLIDWLAVWR